MECHIAELNMRPVRSPWIDLRVGMSLDAIFALGISGTVLNSRIWHYEHVRLEPILTREQLLKCYKDWVAAGGVAQQHRKRRRATPHGLRCYAGQELRSIAFETLPEPPPPVERACMCCRKPFLSEGKHNRLCGNCRERQA